MKVVRADARDELFFYGEQIDRRTHHTGGLYRSTVVIVVEGVRSGSVISGLESKDRHDYAKVVPVVTNAKKGSMENVNSQQPEDIHHAEGKARCARYEGR